MPTLTDFEVFALDRKHNMADGHATHEAVAFDDVVKDHILALTDSYRFSIAQAEEKFRSTFADVIRSPTLKTWTKFKICPTASLSIQVVADFLHTLGKVTNLLRPTFDNLALILKRRDVVLGAPVEESKLTAALAEGRAGEYLASLGGGAVFLVNPNNPTGYTIGPEGLMQIAAHCAATGKVLILDNSFRLFNRAPFDDYGILAESGVSFIAFEDTGKAVPANEIKASLLICSPELEPLVTEIYREVYLCTSPRTLLELERFLRRYHLSGLRAVLWDVVDARRRLVREAIAGSALVIPEACVGSHLPVEWVDCSRTGLSDLQVTRFFESHGLHVLPGRQFFWDAPDDPRSQKYIRLAMLKPADRFGAAVKSLAHVAHLPFPIFDRREL